MTASVGLLSLISTILFSSDREKTLIRAGRYSMISNNLARSYSDLSLFAGVVVHFSSIKLPAI